MGVHPFLLAILQDSLPKHIGVERLLDLMYDAATSTVCCSALLSVLVTGTALKLSFHEVQILHTVIHRKDRKGRKGTHTRPKSKLSRLLFNNDMVIVIHSEVLILGQCWMGHQTEACSRDNVMGNVSMTAAVMLDSMEFRPVLAVLRNSRA